MLEMTSVTKFYPRPAGPIGVLDDVSLTVSPGEFVAVQGPSGCGKTTLLLTAGGMLRPDSGQVLLAGRDLYALSPDARAALRARAVGFVFQQFHLLPYLSVRENVLTRTLTHAVADAPARADELICRLGLEARRDHRSAELSTGERQRVALARALLGGPMIVLADEPTGNLDADNAAAVLQHLTDFARAGGAVLLVTHDASAAARADRVLQLSAGAIT